MVSILFIVVDMNIFDLNFAPPEFKWKHQLCKKNADQLVNVDELILVHVTTSCNTLHTIAIREILAREES